MPDSYDICENCGKSVILRSYSHHWKHKFPDDTNCKDPSPKEWNKKFGV